ncbi:MAG: radical SAM protein [Lentisphaeria bacterium]
MSDENKYKVLLVYPEIPDNTYWSFAYALSFIGKRASMPPLGLLTIAGMLPQAWIPRLVDENVRFVSRDDLAWCDVVFISSMMVQAGRVQEIVDETHAEGKTVVAGGPYPTQFYEQIRDVDHYVLGETESGVLDLFLKDYQAGTAKKAYFKHVIRKQDQEKQMDLKELRRLQEYFGSDSVVEKATSYPDLQKSPTPRYDLLDIKAYGSMALQLSRGCPFSCEFCSEPALFGHRPRLKSTQQILAELEVLYGLGYRGSVFFVDDNFIGNIKEVLGVLDAIAEFQNERGFPFAFFTEASLNLAQSPGLMERMRDAGFNMVFVGLETTDAATLEAAHKHQNTGRELLDDVMEIQRYGMEVTAGFIVGMDREPDDVCDQIFAFCQEAGIPTAMVGLLAPLRGSLLFERLSAEGRLLNEPLGGNNTHSFKIDFVPDRGRDPEKIVSNYRKLLSRLYPRDGMAYFKRCERLMENIGESPAFTRKVRTNEVVAFLRSLIRQPWQRYRGGYLHLLLKTLLTRPSVLPEAARLSITGHHFIRITTDALKAAEIRDSLEEQISQMQSLLLALRDSGEGLHEQISVFLGEQRKNLAILRKRIIKFPREYRRDLYRVYSQCLDKFKALEQNLI